MSGQSAPPPAPPGGSMMLMLLFMIVMTFMLMSEGIRTTMGNYADPFLSGWLPEEKWFVLTVLILGTISMSHQHSVEKFLHGSDFPSSYWTQAKAKFVR